MANRYFPPNTHYESLAFKTRRIGTPKIQRLSDLVDQIAPVGNRHTMRVAHEEQSGYLA